MSWDRVLVWGFVSKSGEQALWLREKKRIWGKFLEKNEVGSRFSGQINVRGKIKYRTSAEWCLLRCWRGLQNSKYMRCALNTIQQLMLSKVKCKKKMWSWKSTYFRGACFSLGGWLMELSKALTNHNPQGSHFMTAFWRLSLCFMPQVTCPGTQPFSTRFPATPHPSGPSKDLLGSLEDQVHLERLENRGHRAHQAFQEVQACRGPQEREVSWVTPLAALLERGAVKHCLAIMLCLLHQQFCI